MNLLKRMQAAHTDASKRLWLPRSGCCSGDTALLRTFLALLSASPRHVMCMPAWVSCQMCGPMLAQVFLWFASAPPQQGHWFSGPKKRPSSPPTLQGPPKRPFPVRWLKPEKHVFQTRTTNADDVQSGTGPTSLAGLGSRVFLPVRLPTPAGTPGASPPKWRLSICFLRGNVDAALATDKLFS